MHLFHGKSYLCTKLCDNMDTEERAHDIYRVTATGSVVNFLLTAFKFVAGLWGHSAAMIADAVHSLSDLVTDLMVVVFVRISVRPQDKDHDYGHGKYETLAAALIGIALFLVGIGIFWDGAVRIVSAVKGEALERPGMIAFWAALLSIAAKEIVFRYTLYKGKQLGSQAVIVNAWHHRSDALSSVGTAAGIGGAILLGRSWTVLDPIAAVVVSLFIIRVAFRSLVPCVEELLEKSLPEETEKEIEKIVLSVEGVSEPHHLRTRRIGEHYAIEVHIRMDGSLPLIEAHRKATDIERKLKERYGAATHVGIHVEPVK